jgi:DNA ligase 1
MRLFSALYTELDSTTKTSRKVDALARYFKAAAPADAAWALFFLSGRRLKRLFPAARLAQFAAEHAKVADWLFYECAEATGDLAEAAALVLPAPSTSTGLSLSQVVNERVIPLRDLDEQAQRELVLSTWDAMSADERFVWNKLVTGAFRVGVSELLVLRGLSSASGVEPATLKHRTMGDWDPTDEFFRALTSTEAIHGTVTSPDRPYPFFLAHPLNDDPKVLGSREEWQVEWKWDGIRCQAVRREDVFLWSRGEELVTDQFPEVRDAIATLPKGTVVDGELLPWKDGNVLGFSDLQRRLNRKKLTPALLEEVPMVLLTYDLLEHNGEDIRGRPMNERRALLEKVIESAAHPRIILSPVLDPSLGWDELTKIREESRERRVEGFMLKKVTSQYGVGRKTGEWWKHKIDPYSVDAVLIYAQHGSGKRASLFTDYTFAVWDGDVLVPFAKAYSGLTDEEIREVDAFVRKNTTEKFGPVRAVKPELVFELGFEGIAESKRHKSGVAVRFPRMLRWRKDKPAKEADTLATLKALL